MAAYTYRPELKPPGGIQSIDFGNPKLAPMLTVLARNLHAAVNGWRPPVGVALQQERFTTEGGATVDCYVLEPASAEAKASMLFCHGGAFLLPVQTTALQMAAYFVQRLGLRVCLPEYRLLPQHPWPAAFEDCRTAWQTLAEKAGSPLLLYGESAGGALAAGLTQWLRDNGGPWPAGQLLVYPVLDDRPSLYASMTAWPKAAWSRASNDFMWRSYLVDKPPELYAVPMRCTDLQGLPPAYVEPQEIDILHDEAVAYAGRLEQAGVEVELNEIAGSYHGFDTDLENPFVQSVLEQRVRAMARMLSIHNVLGVTADDH